MATKKLDEAQQGTTDVETVVDDAAALVREVLAFTESIDEFQQTTRAPSVRLREQHETARVALSAAAAVAKKAEDGVGEVQQHIQRTNNAIKELDERIKTTDITDRQKLGELVFEQGIERGTNEALTPRLASGLEDQKSAEAGLREARIAFLEAEVRVLDDDLLSSDEELTGIATRAVSEIEAKRERFNAKKGFVCRVEAELRQVRGDTAGERSSGYGSDASRGTLWGALPAHLWGAEAIAHVLRDRLARTDAMRAAQEEIDKAHSSQGVADEESEEPEQPEPVFDPEQALAGGFRGTGEGRTSTDGVFDPWSAIRDAK